MVTVPLKERQKKEKRRKGSRKEGKSRVRVLSTKFSSLDHSLRNSKYLIDKFYNLKKRSCRI